MITDTSELMSGAEVSADICIIGSGAAGITLASDKLKRRPRGGMTGAG